MRCPFCASLDTRVIDSRLVGEGDQIRRRRSCNDCQARFTTYESAELNLPRIVKSDGRREPFQEDKLLGGIIKALEKRAVEMDRIEVAVAKIKQKLQSWGEREIKSRKLGDWVMEELRELDQVAYVRFASVYRSFEDVKAFLEEIERLENDLPPELKESQLTLLPSENGTTAKNHTPGGKDDSGQDA
ncbi:MAG: transcriptional regulator NrdR [Gammaproteobacteria bacterium]